MSKQFKEIFIFILIIFILLGCYLVYYNININGFSVEIFKDKIFIITFSLISLLIIIFFIKNFVFGRKKSKELKHRDKLFNSLVINSDTIYIMYNVNNNEYTYITKNVEEVLGVKLNDTDKTETKVIDDLLNHPVLRSEMDDWNRKDEFVSQMLSYKKPEYQHVRWIKVKIYPFKDKKKKYHVILISDVTKEHDQQHLLVSQASDIKTRERQLNQITSTSYDVEIDINVSSKDFTIKNLKSNINYLGENRSGNYVLDFDSIFDNHVNKNDLKNVKKMFSINKFMDLYEKKEFEPLIIRYRINNEKDIVWLESTAFFTTSRGEMHVIILTKNVTENAEFIRKQNIMLQEALDDSKKANKAKDEFLAIISHEIRTPMNAIVGLSTSVLEEKLDNNIKEDIQNINDASHNVLEIIDGILDISKIEEGIMTIEEKEYNTAKFFKEIETVTKKNMDLNKVKFYLDCNDKLPTILCGDSGKIRQIIMNIINNSIKFTNDGYIKIKIDFKKEKANFYLNISIIDTGIGIEPEKLSRLFDDSKKVVKNDNQYIEGMGLSISKKLIDLMKGEIAAESEVGKGTIINISVEQKIIDNTPIGDIETYIFEKKKINTFDAKGKNVFVVDDNKLNIKVAQKLLKPYNIMFNSTDNGNDAVKYVTDNLKNIDLILLDQMMPEMDGIKTLNELKKIKGFDIPVVVLTADAIVGKKQEYLSKGFDDYLSKPIDNNELNRILKKYLNK